MACLKGFEPPTNGLEGRCSILLSYRHRQCVVWSGWWESDPRSQLGRLVFYHWTTPALQQPLHYISVAKNCQRFEIFFCDFFREVSYFGQQVTNFATTFVVIRLQEVNTFKKLVSRLAGKVQLCRAQKFARTALLKRRWKTRQLAPQFWNTFVVIRLLKASTFKKLVSPLVGKVQRCRAQKFARTFLLNRSWKNTVTCTTILKKIAPVVCRLYKPDKVRQRQKQPCEVVASNYLFFSRVASLSSCVHLLCVVVR